MHFANEDALRAKGPATTQPRAALVPRLPWAGLFAHRWRSLQMRSKVHERLSMFTPNGSVANLPVASVAGAVKIKLRSCLLQTVLSPVRDSSRSFLLLDLRQSHPMAPSVPQVLVWEAPA